ncbi:putative heme-binding domain-containing protein [Neolewinella xylanilytica]|uniref:Putative heme-binding domain-containing protein n=1 Tax=Neolewinella xylanilytica TaxID=1514080 RepID=A0A2S6IAG3_9BACT|nr:HEAT repeat domain-containing protein [Neolewinella xylanilytica]PPK88478.1 putative heme-binding domain-containing protein [Neolewinella xylanilytica]
MQKTYCHLFFGLSLLAGFTACSDDGASSVADLAELDAYYGSFDSVSTASVNLVLDTIAGPEIVPSPACLAVLPTGEVFVGVDMMGSLGKDPGKGSIVRLVDADNDGTYESHNTFAAVDNPRGIMPVGDKVYVLHTRFEEGAEVASTMDLVVFEDGDGDGVADGPSQPLIENISSPAPLQDRGTDHSTNGIRMGIDGWIYVAVGDFGFHDATDRDGTKLTMLGGGIVRVRPDGTEMEVYTHGTRNIYDVAIDPFMNVYTRGNTNDGGGWNIRFLHHVQSGEYGYPTLFKHFTDEILPALVDVGGGSGVGSYFMDDDRWPARYNHVPMMADWGRNQLYLHRVERDGPGFVQQEEEFIELPQITDIDLDGSGRMFLSAWDGAGYRGSDSKGFVVKVVPEDWSYEAFPDLESATTEELGEMLQARNSVTRFHAQQRLLRAAPEAAATVAWEVAGDERLPLEARVAGVYTYAQITCGEGVDNLVTLTEEARMREFALRALADRKTCLESVPLEPFLTAVTDPNPRVRAAAIVGLGRLGRAEAAETLLAVEVPASVEAPGLDEEGPHATPNADIILPHLAVQSLNKIGAVEATVSAIESNPDLALWALRYMHDTEAVEGLIAAYDATDNAEIKEGILTTLARLYHEEAPYEGDWWWSTRPDTHGPYYKAVDWEGSERIEEFLLREAEAGDRGAFFARLNERNRLELPELGTVEEAQLAEESNVDLDAITSKEGEVGKASIEDVILAMAELEGNPARGEELFTEQGCVACHAIDKGEVQKGPFMGQIGSIMTRDQITESIIKPNASISQGFSTYLVETADNAYVGFVTAESADALTLRDIGGNATELKKEQIKSREELDQSMMPTGLVNGLSMEELASLVTFLERQK